MSCRIGLLVLPLFILILVGGPADNTAAQVTYGKGSPGAGGFIPILSCNQAYMGNGKFAFQIQKGKGGTPGLLGLSVQPASFRVGSTQILINLVPPNLLLLLPVSLGGQPGQPGVGTAAIPLPLAFPPTPALAGLDFYAQFVAFDYPTPGSPAASRGLKVEMTYPPVVFVGTSVGGSTDPHYFVDPLIPILLKQANSTYTDNCTGAEFAYGGMGLFIGSSIRHQVNYADVSTLPAQWRTIYTSSGSGCYGMGYDKPNRRLYTLTNPGNNQRELVALDVVNPSSPNFGKALGNTVMMAGGNPMTERWTLAPSGKTAAVLVGFINTITLTIVDTDPKNLTYLKVLMKSPVPVSGLGGLSLATQVRYTQDEDVILVTIQNAGANPGEIARYDVGPAKWIDHNPSQTGIQNIGPSSAPVALLGSAPTDIEMAPDGTFAVISGFAGPGWAGRLDLVPGSVSHWGYQTLTPGPSLRGAWACGLSRDGSLMSIGTFPSPQLVLVDPKTGKLVGTVGLPGASNVYTVEHR